MSSTTTTTILPDHIVILLVEDRADDVLLVKRALAMAGVKNPLFIVPDGEQAISYLDGFGPFADRVRFPMPGIILLDLKLPKLDGFDVLNAIRARPHLRAIRIIVLTSSQDIFDMQRAYDLGASSFLVKPFEFENYTSLMDALNAFWLQQNVIPSIPPEAPSPGATKQPPPSA